MDLWIQPAKESDHAHVQSIVIHRRESILMHRQIDAHESRIRRSCLKAEQRLRKDLLLRESSQHLAKITNLDAARRSGVRLSAVLSLRAQLFGLVQAGLRDGYFVAQSACQQRIAQRTEILAPPNFFRNCRGVTEIRRVHQFEVLLILRGGPRGHLIDPLAKMALIRPAESRESIEEMIVPRHPGRRHKPPPPQFIHKRAIQILLFERSGCGNFTVTTSRLFPPAAGSGLQLHESELRNIHAQMVFSSGPYPP